MTPISLLSPQTYIHILVALLMLTVPGLAVIIALRRYLDKRPASLGSALLPGVALGIAVWPLLLLYLSLLGLELTPWLAWLLLAIAGGYVVASGGRWATDDGRRTTAYTARITHHASRITYYVSLLAITLLYLAFRLGDIQGLTVPMFGDSLHHTMVTSLIMDGGRVPAGYMPYVPVETFTYHFGFHTLAATFAMLVGATPQYAVLLLGQVLNALAVPFAYMLNRTLFGSRLAGLGAALLTAVISLMPAFYVNWGRYTQLSGQMLLMLALVALVRVMRPGEGRRSDFVLLMLSVAGLVVVHYRILIFFGLFAVALGAWQLFSLGVKARWRSLLMAWGRAVLGMALGLLVALPWVINLIANYVRGLVQRLGTVTADYLALYNNPQTLPFYLGRTLPLAAFVGLIAGLASLWWLRRKRREIQEDRAHTEDAALPPYAACIVLTLWVELLVASLWVVPGAIGSYSVAIALYIPLAALGGYGISALCGLAQRLLRVPRWAFAPLLVVAAPLLALWSGIAHVGDPAHYNYLQGADEQAFTWVKANTPSTAKFLISSEFSYSGRAVTAGDAGMWLPLLTGRNVSVPALNSWMERPIEPDFFTRTRQLAAYTQPITPTLALSGTTQTDLVGRKIIPTPHKLSDPEAIDLMRGLGVTHIYVGAQGGASKPRLDVTALRRDTLRYKLVYFKDGVYVFEVVY